MDLQIRILERLLRASADPAIWQAYVQNLLRGQPQQAAAEMARLLELRRLQLARPGAFGGRPFFGARNLIENARRLLMGLNRAGYAGMGPARRAQPFTRPVTRMLLRELATRGSAVRLQLAQFIRLARANPAVSQLLRQGVTSGRMPAVLRYLGGQMGTRAGLRLAVSAAGRTLLTFMATAAGLITVVAAVLLVALALSLLLGRGDSRDGRVAINCDCSSIEFGILTGPYIDECQAAEKQLNRALEEGTFVLNEENGVITGGNVCNTVAAGPEAWPVPGAPYAEAAPAIEQEVCERRSGLTQRCEDRPN